MLLSTRPGVPAGRLALLAMLMLWPAGPAAAQERAAPFTPEVGQPGKDVIWVPTPPELVERMLDLARVTPEDFVVDLGSGDGRNVIAAARRGARGLGIEYNPQMVEYSRRSAADAGVAERARFEQGDMFKSDFSSATVLALFLLPSNMLQLRAKFLELQPGARIVSNTFEIQDWAADEKVSLESGCGSWCTALLWVVPARAAGRWTLADGELSLTQQYQMLSGTLTSGGTTVPVTGRLRGAQISLTAGARQFEGRVAGDVIEGTIAADGGQTPWTATRVAR